MAGGGFTYPGTGGFKYGGPQQLVDFKDSVRAATTAARPANTRSGNTLTADGNGALASQYGVALAAGEFLLVKDEGTGANNGLYRVRDLGGVSTPWILDRRSDADTDGEVTAGLTVWVTEGTVNADTCWQITTNDAITLNTTALTFTQVSGLGQITAGDGLSKRGRAQTFAQIAQNTPAAAAGAQQYGPMVSLGRGQGWKTDAGGASVQVEWATQVRPVQGAANPTSVLDIMSQIGAGGWTKPMTLDSAGKATVLTGYNAGNYGFRMGASAGSFTSSGGIAYLDGSATQLKLRVNEVDQLAFTLTDATLSQNLLMGAKYLQGSVMTPPAAPAAGQGRQYYDTSGGEVRLMVIFPTGAAQQISIEP